MVDLRHFGPQYFAVQVDAATKLNMALRSRFSTQFQKFVKSAAVVNDSSERAVKLVQETVSQTISEKKLQKMLLVKSKIDKPKNRTKKAYREASSSLTPSEQLDLVFGLTTSADEEMEISSNSEMDSSMEIVDDEEVVDALVEENECF